MVRTSGIIFTVMGLRRAARYLVSISSMVFWMKVRSRSRSINRLFFKRCVSSVLAIWEIVPAGFGTRTPGFGGQVNVSVGVMQRYSAGVRIMPMYP